MPTQKKIQRFPNLPILFQSVSSMMQLDLLHAENIYLLFCFQLKRKEGSPTFPLVLVQGWKWQKLTLFLSSSGKRWPAKSELLEKSLNLSKGFQGNERQIFSKLRLCLKPIYRVLVVVKLTKRNAIEFLKEYPMFRNPACPNMWLVWKPPEGLYWLA